MTEETNRDLMALYERGEISAEELVEGTDLAEGPQGIKPFSNYDDDIYLSLNVQNETADEVTFRIGVQQCFGIEFLGFRNQTTAAGKRTRQGTMCKYRAMNGVTVVSMCGRPEWCQDGYYYSLAKREDLGVDETQVEKSNVFIMKEDDDSEALMDAESARKIRKHYASLTGSSTYDPQEHNQVVRGLVLKVMGPDEKNGEMTVSAEDFELIKFAVRAYNKYMNDNAMPGEFDRHVRKMINAERLLAPPTEIGTPLEEVWSPTKEEEDEQHTSRPRESPDNGMGNVQE